MSQPAGGQTYSADTSALIDLKDHWSPGSFPSVWAALEGLVTDARLVAPFQVLEELRRKDDELKAWAEAHKPMFKRTDQTILTKTADVLREFPDLVDPLKEHEDADPYVVATAVLMQEGQQELFAAASCTVLTTEHRRIGKSRIPHACAHFGIECFDFRELFKREGWAF